MVTKIAKKVAALNGRTFYVGGYVRDIVLGRENKDIDIEVHGVTVPQLEDLLDSLGERISMGESFGVFALKGYPIDIAMPRRETATGHGHKDFEISVDPFAGTYSAAKRRDFTMNALMQDVLTGELIDHFDGIADLKSGVIRHVNDESFREDPLRVLRAAQFAARFGFRVAHETVELCQAMDLSTLPRERIEGELEKALLKADKPSIFFETLEAMNQLDVWFPEVKALMGVGQNQRYHAEGDVWTHTMMVLDAAAKYRDRALIPMGFMLAALTHDFGKAICTETVKGVIHAYDHERKGLPLVRAFMERLTGEIRLTDYVLNLTELHMKPNTMAAAQSSVKSTNKLFDDAVDPTALIFLALSDGEGKIATVDCPSNEEFLFRRLEIYNEYMERPYVMGRDLISAGLRPGPNFSELLDFAHKLRLAGVSKEQALKQVLSISRKV